MLTAERARDIFNYDAGSGDLTWKVERRAGKGSNVVCCRPGDLVGCIGPWGYRVFSFEGSGYRAHRVIWLIVHGEWPAKHLDHVNGDRADNRLVNLRECGDLQNARNRGKHPRNTSGFKGVSWDSNRGKWIAQIRIGGKRNKYLGRFDSAVEAHAAYCVAAAQYHGEFANAG